MQEGNDESLVDLPPTVALSDIPDLEDSPSIDTITGQYSTTSSSSDLLDLEDTPSTATITDQCSAIDSSAASDAEQVPTVEVIIDRYSASASSLGAAVLEETPTSATIINEKEMGNDREAPISQPTTVGQVRLESFHNAVDIVEENKVVIEGYHNEED